jgi:hypothetical protein
MQLDAIRDKLCIWEVLGGIEKGMIVEDGKV